jgi:hypothetical protein
MKATTLLALFALSSSPLAAQNWVTNGDFSSGLSGWTQTGYAWNPTIETWDTTGTGASMCFACSPGGAANPGPFPPATLDQNVVIAQGIAYELSADVSCTVVTSLLTVIDAIPVSAEVNGVQVALTTFGTVMSPPLPKEWRARVCGRFVSATSGLLPLSLRFSRSFLASATTARVHIDNIALQMAVGPTFNVDGPRRINKSQLLSVAGTPGATYAVALAPLVLPAGLPIPGFSGLWYLDPATTTILLQGTLDMAGKASIGITVPNDPYLTLAPTFFQPAQLTATTVQVGFHHGAVFTQ